MKPFHSNRWLYKMLVLFEKSTHLRRFAWGVLFVLVWYGLPAVIAALKA